MKFPQPLATMKAPRKIFVASALALFALSNSAQAIVTVTFAQAGSNVTATLSGSLRLPAVGFISLSNASLPTSYYGSSTSFGARIDVDNWNLYTGGQAFSSGLSQQPDLFSGTMSFAYINSTSLLVSSTIPPEGFATPTGTYTWSNSTLAGIGLGSLTTTPVTVFESPGSLRNDFIQFVAVPEPSASVLLGFGASALLLRRRRQGRA